MSEEKIVGSLGATKPPNTLIKTTGAVKTEKESSKCILLFTSRRLLVFEIGNESEMTGIVSWLMDYGKRKRQHEKQKKIEEAKSLDEILGAVEHFEVDYNYIEKVAFKKSFVNKILGTLPTLKIKISWNPTILDKELVFFIDARHKYQDCLNLLRWTISTDLPRAF